MLLENNIQEIVINIGWDVYYNDMVTKMFIDRIRILQFRFRDGRGR